MSDRQGPSVSEPGAHTLYLGTAVQVGQWLAWPKRTELPEHDVLDFDLYRKGARPPRAFGDYAEVILWFTEEAKLATDPAWERARYVHHFLREWESIPESVQITWQEFPPAVESREGSAQADVAELVEAAVERRVDKEAQKTYERRKGAERAEEWLRAEKVEEHRQDWNTLFLTEAELAALTPPASLIEGVLPCQTNVILRGRDQSFKTFAALDWALHIAAGKAWCGHEVDQGGVLYVAGEGAYGIQARVAAWRKHHAYTEPLPFTLRTAGLNFHTPGEAFTHMLDWIEGHKVRAVVLDTLRRISGGADGNGPDMGLVIDSIDLVKRTMREVNGSTVTLTHTDKLDKDTRGFSAVEDDSDVIWHAKRPPDKPVMTLKHTKMKDGPELPPITMMAEPVDDSLVLVPLSGATGALSTDERILTFLMFETDEKEEGETAARIITKTKLPSRSVYDALDRMVASGDLTLSHATRPKKYAAPAAALAPIWERL